MSFTEKEWRERVVRAGAAREAKREPFYRGIVQAEVATEQLTSHPAWNWFCQVLSAYRDDAKEALAAIDAEAMVSNDFSHENLARIQSARRDWHSRITTLEEVMNLPKQIVDDAGKAKEKLKALNHAETNEKSSGPAAS